MFKINLLLHAADSAVIKTFEYQSGFFSKAAIKRFFATSIALIMLFSSPTGYAFAQEATSAASQVVSSSPLNASASAIPSNLKVIPTNPPPMPSETLGINSFSEGVQSASIRLAAVVSGLTKKIYKMGESASLVVHNANYDQIKTQVLYSNGIDINADTQELKSGNGTEVNVLPPQNFRPGRYKLIVTTPDQKVEQDFMWGVLAINTDKSVYSPDETSQIAMTVLNNRGAQVCNASLDLKITTPSGDVQEFTTQNGDIKVSDKCSVKDLILTPDYALSYKTQGVGVYKMELAATTIDDGAYTIEDSFEVRNNVPFDVQRVTATRIYPPLVYPMTFNITANRDFSGKIVETVPAGFEISKGGGGQDFDKIDTLSGNDAAQQKVLGVAASLSLPFNGNHHVSLGFGDPLEDSALKKLYFDYGLAGHDGVDFEMNDGTQVLAADSGTVVLADENGDYGHTLVIQHTWGKSYYGHLSKFIVKVGDQVTRGQEVALSGHTGIETGPHLHFGLKPNNPDVNNGYYGKIDPAPLLGINPRQQVLGANTDSSQIITWNVNIKKGESVKLSYQYKTPPQSPEFYKLGPLTFTDAKDNNVFEEARQWQLAIDPVSTKYMEAGTDSTYDFKMWSSTSGTVTSDSTTSKTGPRSIKADSTGSNVAAWVRETGILADAGRRITTYVNFSQFPTADTAFVAEGTGTRWNLRISSTGVLKLYNNTTQIGSNGSTLSTGTWYRVAVSYTITSSSVDTFNVYVNGSTDITVTNATVTTGTVDLTLGWTAAPGASKVMNVDNIYVDDGTDAADPGDNRVTVKLPNANGTNNFNTAVGANPANRYTNVNERALSETNGWEQSTPATATFGYNTQGASTYSVSANHKVFTKFTTGSTVGTVQSASAFLNRTGTGSGYQAAFGIYTDSSGAPSTLVANSQITLSTNLTRNSAQWYTATYGTAPTLSANTTYWIGVEFALASTVAFDAGTTNQSFDQTQTFGALTSPWGASGTGLADKMSYYVTYLNPNYETYGIESASQGDVDITGKTIVARTAWTWSKVGTANSAWILDNGTEVSKSLTTTSAMYTDVVDSSTYPSNASAVGMRSSEAGTTSTFLYETGMLIVYNVPAAPQLTQVHYRWRNDDGSESAATWRQPEDTSATRAIGGTIRLRIEISNEGTQTASSTTYRLEYGTLSTTCNSIGTWTQVPVSATSEAFQLVDSTFLTDASATTGQLTAGNSSFVAGQVKDTGSDTSGISLTSTQYTEIEYSFAPTNNASNGTQYCFRLTNAGSTTNFAYAESTYGLLTVGSATYVQKHFRWRNDDGNENTNTGRTLYYSPTGEGFANSFTINAGCSASNNWDCVNDNSSNASTSTSATSTDSSTSSLQAASGTDYYTLADNAIPDNSTVTRLDVSVWASDTGNPNTNITLGYCTTCDGANNVLGGAQNVNNATYTEYAQSFTGLSISSSTLNGMQLVVSADGTRAAISTVYVKVTYNTTGATWQASEDTSNGLTLTSGNNIRLRVEVANEGNIAANRNFLLQYAQPTTDCSSISSWTTVPITATSEVFEMTTTHNFVNGDTTTAQLTSDGSFTAGQAIEDPSNSTGTVTITNGNYTEYEFVFAANSNAMGNYCFRLSNNGSDLDTYSVYAQIFVPPPLDRVMRHGAWFNNSVKQPFTF